MYFIGRACTFCSHIFESFWGEAY